MATNPTAESNEQMAARLDAFAELVGGAPGQSPVMQANGAALNAGAAALRAPERGTWQPIETAPQDRTVLGWFPYHATAAEGGQAFVMRWNYDEHASHPRGFFEASGWVWGVRDNRKRQPTHWCEMPAPPVTLKEPS